ncbi:MAG: DUF2797 domain-containing protein [Halobacteriales archaeon]
MQIVGYDRGPMPDETAALRLANGGAVREEPLSPGGDLAYTLGERRCAGRIADGTHEACEAETAPYCPEHRTRWPCARCTGDCDLPTAACREEHAVYLAAFAPDTFKVGVTRSWRLKRRLREQGADRAAHVRTVKNGRIARQIEADVATEIPDSVRVPRKIRGLPREVDGDAWTDLLDDFDVIERFEFDYGLDLDRQPITETIATGTVVRTKGRVLLLERAGDVYAVDMRDLVGHGVEDGGTDRSLQSSLGSFG